MKFTLATLASLVAYASAGGGNTGTGPMETCAEQQHCVEFTVEPVTSDFCGTTDEPSACYYNICMTFLDSPLCVKDLDLGGTVSHTCLKSDNECHDANGFEFATKVNSGEGGWSLGENFQQCQKVAAGKTAEFMIKDGSTNMCASAADEGASYQIGTYTATCTTLSVLIDNGIDYTGCEGQTNGGNMNRECIWRVDAPVTCNHQSVETEPPEPPTDSLPTTTTTVADPTTEATEAATEATTTTEAPKTTPGGGGGDPHFQRWGREHDSFHGECDLVLVHSEQFHQGAGFDLHARTKIQDYFSYIDTAAMRVGDNVLEFHKDHFFLNGNMHTPADLPLTFGGEFRYTIRNGVVEAHKRAEYYQYYMVDLHEDSTILFKYYKKFLTIAVNGHEADFSDSVGLLGEYHTGAMIARDGSVVSDFEQYGFEWQVRPDDKVLFREAGGPQLPYERCRMPSAARPSRRGLRQSAFAAEAQQACAHIQGKSFDLCVDDVITTGDVGLATLW